MERSKYGDKNHRSRQKRHLGIDDESHILSSCVTDGHEQDSDSCQQIQNLYRLCTHLQLPQRLAPSNCPLARSTRFPANFTG